MRKLKNKKGFTMIEMLASVVTLILICMIITTGSNLAMKSMNDSLFESESQMLESTLSLCVGDILRHATEIEEKDGIIYFTNDAYYIDKGHFVIDDHESGIEEAGYLLCTSTLDGTSRGLLVANRGIYTKNMYVTDFQLSYDNEKHVFTGSYVIVSKMTDRTKTCEFSYRTIADVKKQQNGE